MTMRRLRLPTFAENNRGYFQLLSALPAAAGSTISVLLIISACWASISMAAGRFRFHYVRTDWYLVGAGLVYTFVMVASIVLRPVDLASFGYALTPVMYITPALIIPRCRAAAQVDYFGVFVRAAPWCGILMLPVVGFELFAGQARIEGGAGNAFPFAMICVFFGPVSLLNLPSASVGRTVLSIVGFLCCVAGLLLSETRTVWLVLVANLAVIGWYLYATAVLRRWRLISALAIVVLMAVSFVLSPRVEQRVSALAGDFQTALAGGVPGFTLSARLALWSTAIKAFEARPVIGYGAHHRRDIIDKVVVERPEPGGKLERIHLHLSHFHNGFLTGMVDAGIFGLVVTVMLLLAPLVLAWRAPRDSIYKARLAMALLLFLTYAITGSVNIMFGQDLIDALFVTGALVVALSVGTGPRIDEDPKATIR